MILRRTFLKSLAGAAIIGLSTKDSFSAEARTGFVAEAKPGVLTWLESVRFKDAGWGRWKYTAAMPRDYGLLSSCYTIFVLDELGELKGIPAEDKREAVEFLKSCRDPATDYMIDPLVRESDHIGEGHSWEHIHAHMNNGAVSALKLLGEDVGSLDKPTKAPFHDLSKGGNVEWLLAQPWKDPWLIGEHMTKAILYYWEQLPEAERTPDEPRVKEMLDALEQHVIDPATGMPTLRGCKSNQVGMAGAFKIYKTYLEIGRTIPHRERAVDFVLDLQRPDGSFGDGPAEKSQPLTIHWDSMWVLRELNKSLENGYRFEDIRAAGNRCAEYLIAKHRKPDGSFSFHRDHCQTVHNSVRVSPSRPISDTTGTMMSMRCLAYADEWNGPSGR